MGKLHRSQLIAEIKENFAELVDPLNKEMGQLCFELNVFSRFTMRMVRGGDRNAVANCYEIALKYYQGGNTKMRDAIDTCYVEDLEFRDVRKTQHAWAWEIMPETLKKLYTDFHGSV